VCVAFSTVVAGEGESKNKKDDPNSRLKIFGCRKIVRKTASCRKSFSETPIRTSKEEIGRVVRRVVRVSVLISVNHREVLVIIGSFSLRNLLSLQQ